MTTELALKENDKPIVYDINADVIAELKKEQDIIIASLPAKIDDLDIDLVKKAKRKAVKLRTGTEAQRKEYKSWVLSYGRLIDSTAADVLAPVVEIESVYEKLINDYDAHFAELSRITAEKEANRIAAIQDRILRIKEFIEDANMINKSDAISQITLDFDGFVNNNFDYQEFSQEAENAIADVKLKLSQLFDRKKQFEVEQEKLEAQRKIDDENRAKFEAEKAEFEAKQREVNAKIEAERAALQKQKDDAEREERARIQAEQEKQRQAELQKQRDELEREKQAQAEKRKLLEDQESARLEQIRIENEARRIAQEKEDRIRNAAPQLFKACLGVYEYFDGLDAEKKAALSETHKPAFHWVKQALADAYGTDLLGDEKILIKGE